MRGNYRLLTVEHRTRRQTAGAPRRSRRGPRGLLPLRGQFTAPKDTPEGDKKARVNHDLGDAMNRALQQSGYQELGPLQQTFVNMSRKIERESGRVHG
jgi:hypothetical protein